MRMCDLCTVVGLAGLVGILLTAPASAVCPGDCAVAGGGTPEVDCLAEYFGIAATAAAAGRVVSCEDGTDCDGDGEVNGACVFNAQVCLNQNDPQLPDCTARGVSSFRFRNRNDDETLEAIEASLQAQLPTTDGVCSQVSSLTVAVGGTPERLLPGRRRIRSDARGDGGRDFDQILLSCEPPPQPLGRRRFSVAPANSPLKAVLGPLSLDASTFSGFLEFEAGVPDENGIAVIDVVNASEYIFADLRRGTFPTNMIVCLKPMVPAMNAGAIGCRGLDASYLAIADHVLGIVGEDGFTAEQCETTCGVVGCGVVERGQCDGNPEIMCAGDVECPDGDFCLPTEDGAHPGVCNGPLNVGSGGRGDSGRGAVALTPDPVSGLQGLPFEITFVNPGRCRGNTGQTCVASGDCGEGGVCMQACGDGPPGQVTPLPFFSGPVEVFIEDIDGQPGSNRDFQLRGENFSCANWTRENGPGRLVFGLPQLHGFSIAAGAPPSDLITAFVLSDR
jgi:hypothetical protein